LFSNLGRCVVRTGSKPFLTYVNLLLNRKVKNQQEHRPRADTVMSKTHKSFRFIVVLLAIIAVSTLAIAAGWGSSYAFGLFAPSQAAAVPLETATNAESSLADSINQLSTNGIESTETVPVFEGRLTQTESVVQPVTITNEEGDGNIDMGEMGIRPTIDPVGLRRSRPGRGGDGAAHGTSNAHLGITHEFVNQNTTSAFGTLSSGWTPAESVQFYLNGVLASTFAANADGVVAVGINTGAGFGFITIDQIGLTSGKEVGGVVQVSSTGPYLTGVTGAAHAINTTASGKFYLYGWRYPVSSTVNLYRDGVSIGTAATSAAGRFFVTVTPANSGDTSVNYSADTGAAGSMAGVSLEERADAGTPPAGDQNAARVFYDRATLNSATGGTVALVGEGFQAGETVNLTGCVVGSVVASANGAAAAFISYGPAAGVSQCVLTGASSGRIGRGTVLLHANVTNSRGLIVAPSFVTPGSGALTVLATKLPASDLGQIYLDGVLQGTATTNASGDGAFTLTKPASGFVHSVSWIATSGTGPDQAAALLLGGVPPCTAGNTVEVVASAGTMGPTNYLTVKGAFDAINAGTHQGDVDVKVCQNTVETATASLN